MLSSDKDYVLDQLATLGAVRARAVYGYFSAPMLAPGRTIPRAACRRSGRIRARHSPLNIMKGRTKQGFIYEVPADVLDDTEILAIWAHAALSTHPDKRGK